MSIDNPAADEIHDIEISIDGAGLEPAALDEATRRLAEGLRSLPHENVGIIADPAPRGARRYCSGQDFGRGGDVAQKRPVLPKAVEVVQAASQVLRRALVYR